MAKIAEEIIIQTKPFLRATLFIYVFILPCMYHFCGPRKIMASCLEGGYHLDTSNVLFISGEKAQSHGDISAEGCPGSNVSASQQRNPIQTAGFEPAFQSPKGNFSLIYVSSNSCLSPFYQTV